MRRTRFGLRFWIVLGCLALSASSLRAEPRFVFSFHQGFIVPGDDDIVNLDNNLTSRETRYSLLTQFPIADRVTAFGEAFGESSAFASWFAERDVSLEPIVMQAGAEYRISHALSLKAGLIRLPVGVDGASRDVGLAERPMLSMLYQPSIGFAPRNFRGALLNRYFELGAADLYLDLYYGEMAQNTAMEFSARLTLPTGAIGPLLSEGTALLAEDNTVDNDILRNVAGARLELAELIPTLTMVASGWIGTLPAEGDAPRKQKDVWTASIRGDWSFWTLKAEYGEQASRAAGLESTRTVFLTVLNTFWLSDRWAWFGDYRIVWPDFKHRRDGTYRMEMIESGFEWLPWPNVALHLTVNLVRGEFMLIRSDRFWSFEPYYIFSTSVAYF